MPRVVPALQRQSEDASRQVGLWRVVGRVVGVFALLVLVALVASRFVPHPVGPARTDGKYRGKAVTTATSALSEVETVLLVARAASDKNAFGPYTSLIVSDAEEGLAGTQGTFDSIQPPDARSDALHDQLESLLSQSGDDVRAVRLAARRGELRDLSHVARPLADDAAKLQSFIGRNQ